MAKSQIYRNKLIVGLLLDSRYPHISNYIYDELRRLLQANSNLSEVEFSPLFLHFTMDLANLTKFWKLKKETEFLLSLMVGLGKILDENIYL